MRQLNGSRLAGTVSALILQTVAVAGGLAGQEPDTVPADTQVVAQEVGDTAEVKFAAAFPDFPDPTSRSPGLVVRWDHEELLATGALSLADLLEYQAPFVPARAGYFEGPQASVFAGAGPASLRLTIDGYEYVPLLGGFLDWHQPAYVGHQRVRLIREPGGYEIATETYRRDRPEAYSRIEGSTGDPRHNIIRAYFASEFLGGPLAFGFDRVSSATTAEIGSTDRTAILGSLARRLPGDVWGKLEYRRSSVDRDSFPSPTRDDWVFRLRRAFPGGWYADVIAGTGRRKEEAEPPAPGATDTMPELSVRGSQIALRGARVSERWRAFLSLRVWDGEGLPDFEPQASLEFDAGPASVYARGKYSDWGAFTAGGGYGAVKVSLPLGFRAIGEVEGGDRGLIAGVPVDRIRYMRWTLGGQRELHGWTLSARGGRWKVKASPGIGLPFDSATVLDGGTVRVFEASAGGPVFKLFRGALSLNGRYFRRQAGVFLYWPQQEWHIGGTYRTLLLSDQLELLIKGLGGIRGSMFVEDRTQQPAVLVSADDLFWFLGEVVVRIRDVHIFITYEAFDADTGPKDVPGFPLRRARTLFGLKWEFWN